MDPFSIAMMVASAALQYNSQAQAAAAQKRAAVEAQHRQLAAQNMATEAATKRAQEFQPEVRKERQDQIAQDLTQQYQGAAEAKPITAQGVEVGQTIPGGTADYLASKGREVAKAAEANRKLAALFGRIGSAGQLRRDEAVGIGDTAGQIGRIQTGANNIAGIDQVGIEAAGQPSLGGMIASQALGQYAKGRASTLIKPQMVADAPGGFGADSWLVGFQ